MYNTETLKQLITQFWQTHQITLESLSINKALLDNLFIIGEYEFSINPEYKDALLQSREFPNNPANKTTLLHVLAITPAGVAILRATPPLLTVTYLNAKIKQGPHQGKTVAWLLTFDDEGLDFLLKNPKLLKKVDLNAKPKSEVDTHYNITLAGFIVGNPKGIMLFQKHPALLDDVDFYGQKSLNIFTVIPKRTNGRFILKKFSG